MVAEASIPVDLFNPGQVFACIGFAEAADILFGDAEGCFDWSKRDLPTFQLRSGGAANPIRGVLEFLSTAKVTASAPHGSPNVGAWKTSWNVQVDELRRGAPFPAADPASPEPLPAVLASGAHAIRLEHWLDGSTRDTFKLWTGASGYPGVAAVGGILESVRARCLDASTEPFALSAPITSSLRLDWRRDYVPIDAGFSLNPHDGAIRSVGYPLVELLGAVGLTHARPQRLDRFKYRYGVVGTSHEVGWLPLSLLRAGLGGSQTPFEARRFNMFLGSPGKEGQARAITQVTEESES